MDPDSEQPVQSIPEASWECLKLFCCCISKAPNADAKLFEDAAGRFRTWTQNFRVFSPSDSLDTQLRERRRGQIRQMIMDLLDVLKQNLSPGMQLITIYSPTLGLTDLTMCV